MSKRLYPRPSIPFVPHLTRGPPLMVQKGGAVPVGAILSGLAAAHEGMKALKPATKAKKLLDNSEFKKKHPTVAGFADKLLKLPIAIGYGPTPTVAVVVKKKTVKRKTGAKKRVVKKK